MLYVTLDVSIFSIVFCHGLTESWDHSLLDLDELAAVVRNALTTFQMHVCNFIVQFGHCQTLGLDVSENFLWML